MKSLVRDALTSLLLAVLIVAALALAASAQTIVALPGDVALEAKLAELRKDYPLALIDEPSQIRIDTDDAKRNSVEPGYYNLLFVEWPLLKIGVGDDKGQLIAYYKSGHYYIAWVVGRDADGQKLKVQLTNKQEPEFFKISRKDYLGTLNGKVPAP